MQNLHLTDSQRSLCSDSRTESCVALGSGRLHSNSIIKTLGLRPGFPPQPPASLLPAEGEIHSITFVPRLLCSYIQLTHTSLAAKKPLGLLGPRGEGARFKEAESCRGTGRDGGVRGQTVAPGKVSEPVKTQLAPRRCLPSS